MGFIFNTDSITPDSGSGGGGSAVIDSLSVTPSTSLQTITASGGVAGYSPISVAAVTASIDANIVAGNIKKDVTILSVTGTYEGSGSSTKYGVNFNSILGDIDNNGKLQAPSTSSIFNLPSNVTDIASYALRSALSDKKVITEAHFLGLTAITGTNALDRCFNDNLNLTVLDFPELITISGEKALYYMCSTNSIGHLLSTVNFPKLKYISGQHAMYSAFQGNKNLISMSFPKLEQLTNGYIFNTTWSSCSNLTSVLFPELNTINGRQCFSQTFNYTKIAELRFPKVSTLKGSNVFASTFAGDSYISDIYFNALTTTSFGTDTDQFKTIFSSTGSSVTHTIHFPSNLTTIVSNLQGYPLFGGTNGYVTIAFDLPATS